MEQPQIKADAPPDTKKMVQKLEETTGMATDIMNKLHEQGGKIQEKEGKDTHLNLLQSKWIE
jgi:hypothetical protein